jgi:predicted aminopeptidase
VSPAPASRSSTPLAPAAQASATTRSASGPRRARTRRHTKASATGALLLALLAAPGCYYAHLAAGQARLLLARRSLDAALADPSLDSDLRERLALVREVRAFAPGLGLRLGGQYTSYAAWPGDRVVTSVVATRPGEIEPAPFRFPIVGEVPYKGFFDPARADAEAAKLRARGLDVCVVPVPAYSTLGWFDDPVTTPLLRLAPGRLVETLLHELVHANVFAASAARFNEGVATFVGQEAALRFFAERAGPDGPEAVRERERVAESRAVLDVLGRLRAAIAELYAGPAVAARDAGRDALAAAARAELAALPLRFGDPARLARDAALGDACLALLGTYHADLPAYAARLDALGGDLAAFLAEAARAARAPDPRATLLGDAPAPP